MLRSRLPLWYLLVALLAALPRAAAAQTAGTDEAAPFFSDGVLHDIRLAVNSKDWESLKIHYLANDYYLCDFNWNGQTVRNVGVRSRGTGSRSGIKPGLRVDFDRYSTSQKFLGLKSFILRNNTQDPAHMREALAMNVFRRLGIAAPREAFARLFVNNEYVGLYTIVESIDKAFVKKNFDVDDPYTFEYDFDLDRPSPYAFEYLGKDPALYVPSPFKPETHEADPHAEIIERFIWTVNDSADAAWRQMIAEFIDLPAFIRHLAIENFLAEEDGITGDYGTNNFYVFRADVSNRFTVVPWDKSNTFWDGPAYSVFRNIKDGPPERRNRLVLRALGHADLMNAYLDTLLEAADSVAIAEAPGTQSWFEQQVDRSYNLIRSAARADTFKPYSNDDFEAAITALRVFAKERSDAVRAMVGAERGSK
jgi:spore coat protein H